MARALVIDAPCSIGYEDLAEAPLAPNEVCIKTLFSGISAGTELTQYRGTTPFLHKRWDVDRRLFVPGEETSLTYPVRTFGYEEVGEVVECGAEISDIRSARWSLAHGDTARITSPHPTTCARA